MRKPLLPTQRRTWSHPPSRPSPRPLPAAAVPSRWHATGSPCIGEHARIICGPGERRGSDCKRRGAWGAVVVFPVLLWPRKATPSLPPSVPNSQASQPPPVKNMLSDRARGGRGSVGLHGEEKRRASDHLRPVRFSSVRQSPVPCAFMLVFRALFCQPPLPKYFGRFTALRMYRALAPSPRRSPHVSRDDYLFGGQLWTLCVLCANVWVFDLWHRVWPMPASSRLHIDSAAAYACDCIF